MKVEHKTIKELQQKRNSNLNRRIGNYSRSISGFYWNIDRETGYPWFKRKPRFSLFTGVRMENQQFGDEHGLG
jgi:hypothetical protein